MLIIPPIVDAGDLSEKMKMEKGYFTSSDFKEDGGFASAKKRKCR